MKRTFDLAESTAIYCFGDRVRVSNVFSATFDQVDALTSLLVRLTGAVAGEDNLFSYDFILSSTELTYRQRTPLDWDPRFSACSQRRPAATKLKPSTCWTSSTTS